MSLLFNCIIILLLHDILNALGSVEDGDLPALESPPLDPDAKVQTQRKEEGIFDFPRFFSTSKPREQIHSSYPWLIGLLSDDDKVFCSGVLMKPAWVLTLVQCLTMDFSRVTHMFNDYRYYTQEVKDIVRHPAFYYISNKTHIHGIYNDIGLVSLKGEFKRNWKHFHVIQRRLPTVKFDFRRKSVWIHGYGYKEVTDRYTVRNPQFFHYETSLRHSAFVPRRLRLRVGRCAPAKWSYSACVCDIVSLKNHEAFCYNDNGGPVVVDRELIGMVTLAPVSCELKQYFVFVGIYEHLPWIYYTMRLWENVEEAAENCTNSLFLRSIWALEIEIFILLTRCI